jgi:hypothetical protein
VSLKITSEIYVRFKGQMLSLNKSLKSSAKEVFSQCVPLSAAMNYGRLSPFIEYTLINYHDLLREEYHPEKVVITESEH